MQGLAGVDGVRKLVHCLDPYRGIPGSGLLSSKACSRHLERGPCRLDHRKAGRLAASPPQDGGEDETGGEANPKTNEGKDHAVIVVPRAVDTSGSAAWVDHDQTWMVVQPAQMTPSICPA